MWSMGIPALSGSDILGWTLRAIDPEPSTFEVGFTHGPAFLVPHR